MLSPSQTVIAKHLAKSEDYPLAIVASSRGKLSLNSIYVIIDRMEDRGLISSKPDGRRRMCKLTAAGRKALAK